MKYANSQLSIQPSFKTFILGETSKLILRNHQPLIFLFTEPSKGSVTQLMTFADVSQYQLSVISNNPNKWLFVTYRIHITNRLPMFPSLFCHPTIENVDVSHYLTGEGRLMTSPAARVFKPLILPNRGGALNDEPVSTSILGDLLDRFARCCDSIHWEPCSRPGHTTHQTALYNTRGTCRRQGILHNYL